MDNTKPVALPPDAWLERLRAEISDVATIARIGGGYLLTFDDGTTQQVRNVKEVRGAVSVYRAGLQHQGFRYVRGEGWR